VDLSVYDVSGKLVKTLESGVVEAGECVTTWDRTDSRGSKVANGTYFYRLTVDGTTVSRKTILLY
jgi:flagellar basal-body rod modification protein FlgD